VHEYFLLRDVEILDNIKKVKDPENPEVYVKDRYDFETKIKCRADFISVNESLLQVVSEKSDDFSSKKFTKKQLLNLPISSQISETVGKVVSKSYKNLSFVVWKMDREYESSTDNSSLSKSNSVDGDGVLTRISTSNSFNSYDGAGAMKNKKIVSSNTQDFTVSMKCNLDTTNEILKRFSLSDFINEKADISLKRFNNENVFKIINIKDLSDLKDRRRSSSQGKKTSVFRELSERRERLTSLATMKTYLTIVVIIFIICFYILVG